LGSRDQKLSISRFVFAEKILAGWNNDSAPLPGMNGCIDGALDRRPIIRPAIADRAELANVPGFSNCVRRKGKRDCQSERRTDE
jgi:hypothetical protein